MELLEFARGPMLMWSLIIFCAGVAWRLLGILMLRRKPDYSEPRNSATLWGGVRAVFSRMWPRKEFQARTAYGAGLGYVFHIGLAIVVFLFEHYLSIIFSVVFYSYPNLFAIRPF